MRLGDRCALCALCILRAKRETRALIGRGALLESSGDGTRTVIGRFVEVMPGVPLDPLERDVAVGQFFIELFENVAVENRLLIGLLPTACLPPSHPLGAAVDDVAGVAQNRDRAGEFTGLAEKIQNGRELSLVIRPLGPASCVPT